MASVINTNIAATRTHNVYNRNNDYMNAAMTRVATGMKINSAKDGASTWAISEKMRERIRANDQANQNVQNDTAMLKTAQGGIANTIDILKTLKERAVNAANDSNMNSDRERIAVEVQELLTQINENATKVKFNGRTLLDGTGGTDNTGGSSATAAAKVNPPDNTTGSNALFKLSTDSTKKLVDDLGFKVGDKITFSWKEDGTEKTADAITVTATDTLASLATKFGTSGTSSKLTLANVAAGTDVGSVTDGTTQITNTGTTAALYAYGTGETQITDLAVSVTDADGVVNTTAQTAMKFSGVQQAAQTPTGDYAVYAMDVGSGTTTTSQFRDITLGGVSMNDVGNNGTITIKANGTSIGTITTAATDGNQGTLSTLLGASLTTGYKLGLQTTAGSVTASDGTTDTGATVGANKLYLVGPSGTAVTNFTIEWNSGNTSATGSAVQNYKASSTNPSSGNNSNVGGTSTALTFYVGGETGFGVTANISSMKVENLFDGSNVATVAAQFKDQKKAEAVIDTINNALDIALNEQAKLGAMENRLGYASDNLTTMNENLEAADSVMRDSDIAKEMTSYMKYAVLSQASQYMLAQAGQNAFQVLNLLQQ